MKFYTQFQDEIHLIQGYNLLRRQGPAANFSVENHPWSEELICEI